MSLYLYHFGGAGDDDYFLQAWILYNSVYLILQCIFPFGIHVDP